MVFFVVIASEKYELFGAKTWLNETNDIDGNLEG